MKSARIRTAARRACTSAIRELLCFSNKRRMNTSTCNTCFAQKRWFMATKLPLSRHTSQAQLDTNAATCAKILSCTRAKHQVATVCSCCPLARPLKLSRMPTNEREAAPAKTLPTCVQTAGQRDSIHRDHVE
ncbi:hypothetical protein DUNSADRAFT_10098 [Dunaliella salina]|uniref:Encoded protein n=1 Tax=Dunaliella salina TaxID=3046 RepID=A0ABQ7H4Y7_DUNSA|nr:hypothetical protein DUNSADRAFT_10098 [Dunaliella salina]|eukprot:KAF5841927.1 hypothetical protein DUNSADRAFT_10098 [Dunaliella salina]